MPITVNGVELLDAEVEQELPRHQDSDNPLHQAVLARILRRVLLDEAQRLQIDTDDEEQAIGELLERQAPSPAPSEADCRRFYERHPERFTVGACVEAEHILFQVTPKVPLQALTLQAEDVLERARAEPERFAELARRYSNCPSAAVGGSLGQLGRGDTVPEFEKVLFAIPAGTVHPRLVHSRHGLHIVRVARSVPGRLRPYEDVAGDIAQVLTAMGRDTAWRQYTKVLVARAQIEGIDLGEQLGEDRIMAPDASRQSPP
ncbi:peptidylprolyl isomerase [Vandammella animalimorsus]|uniref:peptidylprolyl isomerase n=1 Tax=Vandammella animalimorsus TaxID=2029117 RepID=A0A2A2AWG4_9BURK|nr:peptidylprolyl isomerase [Vandammella animalimorsus]PAT42012.1 peptidylprolyl isomerase [Vandammella animalimorsus]RRD67445.1 peptidylprolyl isomerase [Comamonadaceae bacterium OH2310_COT-174]